MDGIIMSDKIDFVIPWVDGSDVSWNNEKSLHSPMELNDGTEVRYRDLDNLKYWFRGVETYAPWVNKIYFITWGHLPQWLNLSHPKLIIVNHQDFIPEKYLPTFSSHVIELFLHRIKGLSEKFVYFNDDIFIVNKTTEEDFFKNDLPVDLGIMDVNVSSDEYFGGAINNSLYIIKKYFSKKNIIRKNIFKWYNLKYGKLLFKTVLLTPWKQITGFYVDHLTNSYLKSTFENVWEKEHKRLEYTALNKFRDIRDVNQYVFKFWQLASGNFVPGKKIGRNYNLALELQEAMSAITGNTKKIVCLNDSEEIEDFEKVKKRLNNSFDKKFSSKSKFEI